MEGHVVGFCLDRKPSEHLGELLLHRLVGRGDEGPPPLGTQLLQQAQPRLDLDDGLPVVPNEGVKARQQHARH